MDIMSKRHKLIIAVIGGHDSSKEICEMAYEIGKGIAKAGHILVCGGLGGVMEEACKGAKAGGGVTVGILPGMDNSQANRYVDIPIATAMAQGRNAIIVRSADVVVAVGGKYGTLSEIALAKDLNKPVYGLRSWEIEGMMNIETAEEFLNKIR